MPSQNERTKAIGIVGAGIAGLSLAIRLRQFGWSVTVFDARDEHSLMTEGAFLTVAPPGMNGLRVLDLKDAVDEAGMITSAIQIVDEDGHTLGDIDQSDHGEVYGADSVTLSRGLLVGLFLERARALGAEIRPGIRITKVRTAEDVVLLVGNEGEATRFDLVAACDGLNSRMRQDVFPDFPKPVPSGLIGVGGILDIPQVPDTGGAMRMTFGREAFFGYQKSGDGAVHWFDSYPAETSAHRPTDPQAYVDLLRRLHATDPDVNRTILDGVPGIERDYPIHNMPPLTSWHRERVVLVGDAAHAVGPHAGLGASMAIEDALVLANELVANRSHEAAFAAYERRRKPRLKKVVEATERNGSQKRASNWFARMMRRVILPFLIPMGARSLRHLLAYRVDRDIAGPQQNQSLAA